MLTIGFALGVLLFVVGIITYVLAPRVGPNPIFGVRVGYSFASRDVWDKTNRFGGALFAGIGVGVAALAAFLRMLNVPATTGITWVTGVMIVALLAATGWTFVYARRLASKSLVAREIAPVPFRWAYVAPVVITFAVLVALMILAYPQLPAYGLATHFDLNDQPNGWSTRDGFVLGFAGLAALFVLIDLGVAILATREPLVAFGRWGSHWVLDPARGLIYIGFAFSLANLILIAVFLDIVAFNTRGVHLIPLSSLLWAIVLVVGALVAVFFWLARRVSSATG